MKKVISFIIMLCIVTNLLITNVYAIGKDELINSILSNNLFFKEGEVPNNNKGIVDEKLYELAKNNKGQVLTEEIIQIKDLTINEKSGVKTLKGIENFKGLEKLTIDVEDTQIFDNLNNLENLNELNITLKNSKSVKDLKGFKNLPKLKKFNIKYKEIDPSLTTSGNFSEKSLVRSYVKEDVNKDGIVNEIDLNLVSQAYNSKPGDPDWKVEYDINSDSIIDIYDLTMYWRVQ